MRTENILACIICVLILFITNCGPNTGVKHREYFIADKWQRCDWITTEACGDKFNCAGEVFSCMNNVRSRAN